MSRRTLAVSVVATISLAELACAGTQPTGNPPPPAIEEHGNPPGPEPVSDDGDVEPADDGADAAADDSGAGKAADGGGALSSKTVIQKRDDGTCVEVVEIDCPEGVMCNPPPPTEVPCPPAGA